ncbi:MAG: hypothetical protein Q9213_003234 [Squamulea squamosa]
MPPDCVTVAEAAGGRRIWKGRVQRIGHMDTVIKHVVEVVKSGKVAVVDAVLGMEEVVGGRQNGATNGHELCVDGIVAVQRMQTDPPGIAVTVGVAVCEVLRYKIIGSNEWEDRACFSNYPRRACGLLKLRLTGPWMRDKAMDIPTAELPRTTSLPFESIEKHVPAPHSPDDLFFDRAAERKSVLEIVLAVLPMLFLFFKFSFVDRNNIARARFEGIERSLHISPKGNGYKSPYFLLPYPTFFSRSLQICGLKTD